MAIAQFLEKHPKAFNAPITPDQQFTCGRRRSSGPEPVIVFSTVLLLTPVDDVLAMLLLADYHVLKSADAMFEMRTDGINYAAYARVNPIIDLQRSSEYGLRGFRG